MTTTNKTQIYFLIAIIAIITVITFFIFKPFLYAFILAIICATVFNPVHKKIHAFTKGKKAISALLTSIFILLIVIVPLSFLSFFIFQEATQLYVNLSGPNATQTTLSPGIIKAIKTVQDFLPSSIADSVQKVTETDSVTNHVTNDVLSIDQYIKQGLAWLLSHFGPIFSNAVDVVMGGFIFLVALYYIFKDGAELKKTIIRLSPLSDQYDEIIFSKLGNAIDSVIKGSIVVAIVQGILTAIGFTIFGIPNALLWGTVTAVAALIPGVGTALIIIPAVIFLIFSGESLSATGLFIWGLIAVGLIDNFLGPQLVEKGMNLHPFLILLSILGGITFFGPLGFLFGPLVLSLLFALVEIYGLIAKK